MTFFSMRINRPVFLKHKTMATSTVTNFLFKLTKLSTYSRPNILHIKGYFVFDNAPSHKKCPEDALKVENMNVRPGGKQLVMRSTVFNGVQQTMVLPDGRPKGLK